jgi:hypothetical protein
MHEKWRQLRVGDRVRLLRVPESDLRQRVEELRDGAEMARWTANTLERIMAADPVVTIDEVDEYGAPWFHCQLVADDGAIEHHGLTITDDDSWKLEDVGAKEPRCG